jgi:hypothetical protein
MDEKQKLNDFLTGIANNELSEIQQQQFSLESKEVLDIMFQSKTVDELKLLGTSRGLDLGLSAETVTGIAKTALDFSGLMISAFALYLQYRQYRKDQLEEKRKEIEESWKKILVEEKIDAVTAEHIATKYSEEFIKSIK